MSSNPIHGEVYSIQHWRRWLTPGTPVSSTNKTDCHHITEILLKVALNTITLTLCTGIANGISNLLLLHYFRLIYQWSILNQFSSMAISNYREPWIHKSVYIVYVSSQISVSHWGVVVKNKMSTFSGYHDKNK